MVGENVATCSVERFVAAHRVVAFLNEKITEDIEVIAVRADSTRTGYLEVMVQRKIDGFESLGIPVSEDDYFFVNWSQLWEQMGGGDGHVYDSCSCGFYAYSSNQSNEYYQDGRVLAIVEGYGETMIGTLGFRSRKAKILALAPSPLPDPEENSFYPKILTGNLMWTSVDSAAGSAGGWNAALPVPKPQERIQQDNLSFLEGLENAMLSPLAESTVASATHEDINWFRIMDQYPGVPIFEDAESMRAAFPTSDLTEFVNGESG